MNFRGHVPPLFKPLYWHPSLGTGLCQVRVPPGDPVKSPGPGLHPSAGSMAEHGASQGASDERASPGCRVPHQEASGRPSLGITTGWAVAGQCEPAGGPSPRVVGHVLTDTREHSHCNRTTGSISAGTLGVSHRRENQRDADLGSHSPRTPSPPLRLCQGPNLEGPRKQGKNFPGEAGRGRLQPAASSACARPRLGYVSCVCGQNSGPGTDPDPAEARHHDPTWGRSELGNESARPHSLSRQTAITSDPGPGSRATISFGGPRKHLPDQPQA